MSELIDARNNGRDFRWQLLTTVSSLALLGALYGTQDAKAEDADRPTVWIELGGQLEQMSGGQEPFAPSFVANLPKTFFSPLSIQKPLQYSYGGEGAISFEPDGSDWVFSVSVRYGRSHGVKQQHQQTKNTKVPFDFNLCSFDLCSVVRTGSFYPSSHVRFVDGQSSQSEQHLILDFEAGKDVGLGIFGKQGSSVVSVGVRIAHLNSRSNVALHGQPDLQYPTAPITNFPAYRAFKYQNPPIVFHDDAGNESVERSFHGVGPKLSWDASAPIAGKKGDGEITFDWGLDAALLFGRQTVKGHHQTTVKTYQLSHWSARAGQGGPYDKVGFFGHGSCGCERTPVAQDTNSAEINRSRSVTVPNLGGFAGLSFRYADAKISFGYRADFFFNAMDVGIDARKSETLGFYGPFATVSVGIGG